MVCEVVHNMKTRFVAIRNGKRYFKSMIVCSTMSCRFQQPPWPASNIRWREIILNLFSNMIHRKQWKDWTGQPGRGGWMKWLRLLRKRRWGWSKRWSRRWSRWSRWSMRCSRWSRRWLRRWLRLSWKRRGLRSTCLFEGEVAWFFFYIE